MTQCPHCEHELTEAEARAIFGSFAQSRRKTRRGGTNGGRPKVKRFSPDSQRDTCCEHCGVHVSFHTKPGLVCPEKLA